jgi:hypothetical protein
MFRLKALMSIIRDPQGVNKIPEVDPPLYYKDYMPLVSCSAFSDILFFAEMSKLQETSQERVRAMFTATEAVFWVVSQHGELDKHLRNNGILLLGKMTRQCYGVLRLSMQPQPDSWTTECQLQQSFQQWHALLSEYLALYHDVDYYIKPLYDIECNDRLYYNATHQIRSLGYGEIELLLDRAYMLVLYGGRRQVQAGFPTPSDLACSFHEGARRRRVRRLLNDAEIKTPPWPFLKTRVGMHKTEAYMQRRCPECQI